MFELYALYHEQDISQLFTYFEMVVSQKSLLTKLKKTKKYTTATLSSLTGISENTIEKYSKSNEYLYKASFEKIYKLSAALEVKTNIFVEHLLLSTDNSEIIL